MDELSDELLMKRYANGDFAAFETLYKRNKGGLYRYLLRQLKQQSKAEELFQDVWSAVIDSASSYQQSAKFTTWLYRIARNKVIDHQRHLKVVSAVIAEYDQAEIEDSDQVSLDKNTTPQQEHVRTIQAEAITHCLEKLPKHQLDSFLLREESGLSLNDIAQILDVGLEAAKSRLKTAYKNLRSCLNQRDIAHKP